MAFVIDVSVMIAWSLEDERNNRSDSILFLARDQGVVVPQLLWFEIRSALLMAERRKRITAEAADNFLEGLEDLEIRFAGRSAGRDLVRLARKHQLTGYDAAYLELAMYENLAIATFDRALLKAAEVEGVKIVE